MRLILATAMMVVFANCFAYEAANEVLENCGIKQPQGLEDTLRRVHCSGYLTGVIDGVLMIQSARPQEAQFICFPRGNISSEESTRVVTTWLERNPSSLRGSARVAVLQAFAAAYPCSAK